MNFPMSSKDSVTYARELRDEGEERENSFAKKSDNLEFFDHHTQEIR